MKKKLCALLLALLCLAGCGGSGSKNWTPAPKSSAAPAWPLAETEAEALTEFSLNLLRENWNGENLLLSPLSVLSALGMTANGAGGETLRQMETVLSLPAEELPGGPGQRPLAPGRRLPCAGGDVFANCGRLVWGGGLFRAL